MQFGSYRQESVSTARRPICHEPPSNALPIEAEDQGLGVGRIGIEQRLDSVAPARSSAVRDEISVARFESASGVADRDVGYRKLSHEHRPLGIKAVTAQ